MLLGGLGSAVSAQDLQCTFETSSLQNAATIGGSIAGLTFSSASGEGVCLADIRSHWYNATSDNGSVFETGEYFLSGNRAAFVPTPGDTAKITFTGGLASYFTVGYSSQFPFHLDAYDALGTLLASASGPRNTKSNGGTGLSYLTVNSPGIAYVTLHDQGGYWMIDNIETNAPVPEPSSLIALGALMAPMLALRRRW